MQHFSVKTMKNRFSMPNCMFYHPRLFCTPKARLTLALGPKHQWLKHAAACRSTMKIGLGFFGGKYRTKLSIPSLSTHLSEMAGTLVVKCCICDWEVSGSFLELTICGTSQGRDPESNPVSSFFFLLCCALTDECFLHFVF